MSREPLGWLWRLLAFPRAIWRPCPQYMRSAAACRGRTGTAGVSVAVHGVLGTIPSKSRAQTSLNSCAPRGLRPVDSACLPQEFFGLDDRHRRIRHALLCAICAHNGERRECRAPKPDAPVVFITDPESVFRAGTVWFAVGAPTLRHQRADREFRKPFSCSQKRYSSRQAHHMPLDRLPIGIQTRSKTAWRLLLT